MTLMMKFFPSLFTYFVTTDTQGKIPDPSIGIENFYCFNRSLPNITIFATGGTIAGSASKTHDGYQAGTLEISSLLGDVPQLCKTSNIRGIQVVNTDSININSSLLLSLSQRLQLELESPYLQGAVVTHGTDTLEESAFFLELTLHTDKPVVVTGAMRPWDTTSSDGPMNLIGSVRVASSPDARGRGVMVVFNERIGSARFISKSHANYLDAFQSPDNIILGGLIDGQARFFYPPVRPLGHLSFSVRNMKDEVLPDVEVVYAYQGATAQLIHRAIAHGTKGIVVGGLGAGYWPDAGVEEINQAIKDSNIPLVMSRRPGWGFATCNGLDGIDAEFLTPQKARIQLQLALNERLTNDDIKRLFEMGNVHKHHL